VTIVNQTIKQMCRRRWRERGGWSSRMLEYRKSPAHPSLSQEELIKWQTQVRETEKRPTTEQHTERGDAHRRKRPLGISGSVPARKWEKERWGGGDNNVVMDYSMASMADGYRGDCGSKMPVVHLVWIALGHQTGARAPADSLFFFYQNL
jgi:hypothetical protein